MPPIYLLDTSVYIAAHQGPYPIPNTPGFWSRLDEELRSGRIGSPRQVFKELMDNSRRGDRIHTWAKQRKTTGLCLPCSDGAKVHYRRIIDYVKENYPREQLFRFAGGADGWLIACAIDGKSIVVTEEVPAGANAQNPKIPNLCNHFGVTCLNTFRFRSEIQIILR